MSDDDAAPNDVNSESSVVDRILSAFVAKVEAEPGLTEAGGRLRCALFDAREDSETNLRSAIFGGDAE